MRQCSSLFASPVPSHQAITLRGVNHSDGKTLRRSVSGIARIRLSLIQNYPRSHGGSCPSQLVPGNGGGRLKRLTPTDPPRMTVMKKTCRNEHLEIRWIHRSRSKAEGCRLRTRRAAGYGLTHSVECEEIKLCKKNRLTTKRRKELLEMVMCPPAFSPFSCGTAPSTRACQHLGEKRNAASYSNALPRSGQCARPVIRITVDLQNVSSGGAASSSFAIRTGNIVARRTAEQAVVDGRRTVPELIRRRARAWDKGVSSTTEASIPAIAHDFKRAGSQGVLRTASHTSQEDAMAR